MLPDRNEHQLTGGDSALRTFTDAFASGPYPSTAMITATLGFPNLVPERAAESGMAIPDLSGPWPRNSCPMGPRMPALVRWRMLHAGRPARAMARRCTPDFQSKLTPALSSILDFG